MDPFSLTTGVITLIGACTTSAQTLSKIKNLANAPGLIQAVNNEISDLRLILTDINEHIERTRNRRSSIRPTINEAVFRLCTSVIDQTKNEVLEVDSLIQYRLLKPDDETGQRVNRRAFLQHHDKLVKLQSELREFRQRAIDVGSILGTRDLSRIEVLLNDIRSQDLTTLIHGQNRLERTLGHLVNLEPVTPNDLHGTHLERSMREPHDPFSSISVSILRPNAALASHKCTCFRPKTSMYFQTFLGMLFLGYTAAPTVSRSDQTCPYHHGAETNVKFFFPLSFLKYAIWVHAKVHTTGTIHYALSVVQILPMGHYVFDLINYGNVDGIKKLLANGQLSIKAQLSRGQTLLHVRS